DNDSTKISEDDYDGAVSLEDDGALRAQSTMLALQTQKTTAALTKKTTTRMELQTQKTTTSRMERVLCCAVLLAVVTSVVEGGEV
ncbi:hypothetical protein HN873_061058, partial [Arachis hypogaea]